MKKMPLFLSVALAALMFASCKKEQEQNLESPSVSAASTLAKPALLSAGNWHQTGLTVSSAAEGSSQAATSDLFAYSKPSQLVQVASYSADGSYTLLRGARPGKQMAEPISGKWSLTAAGDSLILIEGSTTRRMAVAELTANSLRLTRTETPANGKVSTYTSVFSH